jgi:Tfp pilus assembly pilus retraction ATPase PilT
MLRNARRFLLKQLRHALREHAEEVRFVSGQQPSFKIAGTLRPGGEGETRAALVQALHEVCLHEAQREDLRSASAASYSVVLQELGGFQCTFTVKGGTKSLTLCPELEAGAVVEQNRKVKPPPGEAAHPGEES